jgi:hypothetical protein
MAVTRRQGGRDGGPAAAGAAAAATTTTTATASRRREGTTNSGKGGGRGLLPTLLLALLGVGALVGGYVWYYIVPHARPLDLRRGVLTPERLRAHCEDHIGHPRVEEVTGACIVRVSVYVC